MIRSPARRTGIRTSSLLDANQLEALGLPGMFLAAFLAGSVVPAPSEAVLVALSLAGIPVSSLIAVATVGNVLGASTLYAAGRWVGRSSMAPGKREERYLRMEGWLRRHGAPVLLLSWLPVLGDILVLAAGGIGIRTAPFLVFTTLGKGLRYLVVGFSIAG